MGRKLRTALTAIAIVLGVAMVSGTFVLTDSIDQAFDSIFTDVRKGSNVVISGKSAFDLSDGQRCHRACLRRVVAAGRRVLSPACRRPRAVSTARRRSSSATTARRSSTAGRRTSASASRTGDSPVQPADAGLGQLAGLGRGRGRRVDGRQGALRGRPGRSASRPSARCERLRISGIIHFGSASSLGGATLAGFDLPTAQRLFDKEGKLDEIAVAARSRRRRSGA